MLKYVSSCHEHKDIGILKEGIQSREVVLIDKYVKVDKSVRSKLNCVYMNARSVVNKLRELELFLLTECPNILGITETWLHSEIEDAEICFSGYKLFRKDRKKTERQRRRGSIVHQAGFESDMQRGVNS